MQVNQRLSRKIEQDFPAESATVISMLHDVENTFGRETDERILAAVVIVAGGDIDRFFMALELMEQDWRDLLMEADLGWGDWKSRMDAFLDPGEK